VKTKQYQTAKRSSAFCLLVLLVPFLTHQITAAALSTPPDAARIDAFVREQVERHGIPGLALSLIEGEQIIHTAGYGKADQSGRPVTPQTPFILASASKPITALAIMQLVEAGSVELDAPVQRYLPTFRVRDPLASQQITVRHLLNHTSGLPELSCDSSRFGVASLEEFVTALQTIELDAPVGARHAYCSGNYNVLGRVIEVVSDQSYASYIAQHVFAPLEMRHSFTSEEAARQAGLAEGYRWLFGVPTPIVYPYSVAQMPAGFLIASAEDMAHFLIAQLNGGRFGNATILSREGVAAMQAPGVPVGNGQSTYGLGWRTGSLGGVPAISHAGDHPNMHTMVFIEPQGRRGAVLLFNSQNMLAQFGAYQEIQEGVARLLAGQEPEAASLRLPTLYLLIDAVLGGLLALVLWPLVGLRRWERRLRLQQEVGRLRRWRVALRLAWEFATPLALLVGARLLLHMLGAQSWAEGLLLFPDFGMWLWVIALLLLLSGTARLVLLLQVLRQHNGAHEISAQRIATSQRVP
jgi:CubicO group peptidase (beta-lactamase class C family)